ncbi:MAG TPA: hypothetical protein VFF79_18225 [Conexibacter sp.]|nr:hypothetical protein [Conexibacter sp.]
MSYVAIFCQNDDMYSTVDKLVSAAGRAANVTATGTVYVVPEVPTACGPLRIVKVRVPDTSRPERGDADFRLVSSDHAALRARIDAEDALKLIDRDTFTMIELRDPAFDVRAYFSQPPVEEHGNLPEVLKEFGY